ncbi:hypothetical protein DRV84_09770 [Rhodosalinus sediminis]|uniref:Uncharacterized protein n=1 Tax=Rhodosalinus sediminis TaxID=1940533 RepID=A0A3D9BS26_9RHOB|nr:hypothetical protein [Rhodosalinus sediminis]REC56323.1 hypothetical protein DRV84_09770 [Rhodosalinus sediminis]
MEFLEPDPVLLAFIGFRQTVYLEGLVVLAALRAVVARGACRRLALAALAVAAAAVAVKLAALLPGAPLVEAAGWVRTAGGGMAVPLAASAPLLAAGIAPGRRWAWLDWAHLLWLAALLGLWGYAQWG